MPFHIERDGSHIFAISAIIFVLALMYVAWLERDLLLKCLHSWLLPGLAAQNDLLCEELQKLRKDHVRLQEQHIALTKSSRSKALAVELLLARVAKETRLPTELSAQIRRYLDWPMR